MDDDTILGFMFVAIMSGAGVLASFALGLLTRLAWDKLPAAVEWMRGPTGAV